MSSYNGFSLMTRTQLHELFNLGLKNTCVFNTTLHASFKIDFVTLQPVKDHPISYYENDKVVDDLTKKFTAIEISLTEDKLDLVQIMNAKISEGTNLILFVTDNRSLWVDNKVRIIFIKK